MKRVLTIPLPIIIAAVTIIHVVNIGCQQEQVITQLEVGRAKLLDAGLAIEAVDHLKRAEVEEQNKVEPRALLVIAYGYAIEQNMAKALHREDEYHNERNRRIPELGEYEMKKILQILDERHRVQKAAMQILVDKGAPVIPFILEDLIKGRYKHVHGDFIAILTQIGSKGLEQLLAAAGDANTPVPVKIQLLRIIGDIGDASATADLESLRNATSHAGLKMEINTALYLLGNKMYQENIIAGLNDSDVTVRRAAAKAMVSLTAPPTAEIVKELKDADDTVRLYAAEALQKHTDATAVDNLIGGLTSDSTTHTKQVFVNTLNLYAERGLANGLAGRLITLLTTTEVTEHEDRIRMVQLLKKPALLKQIAQADQYDNLPHKLDDYFRTKEAHDMVKVELNELLLVLE